MPTETGESQKPLTGVAVHIIEALRGKHRVVERTGAVAVGLSLETGSCEINHVVCGDWGWYRGPGSKPPFMQGDVITSVDGQIVMPSDVGQRLRGGPLGSKVVVKGLRGNSHTKIEATLIRQDGAIVDGLVHVEGAFKEVQSAARALGGRAGSLLEARLAVLGRHVAKLGSACAKQEAVLAQTYSTHQEHITALEGAIVRLAQGDTDDEVGREAVDGLRERNNLLVRVQELESELASRKALAEELAEAQRLLRKAEGREMARAITESNIKSTGDSEGESLVQLQTSLASARTEQAAARIERDKALAEAEKTKLSANEMLRAARTELAEEKGARELCNTKMLVAKKEAEEARAARESDRKRAQQLDKELAAVRTELTALQKLLDDSTLKLKADRDQVREKANAVLGERDSALAALRKELQVCRVEGEQARRAGAAKEAENKALAAKFKDAAADAAAEAAALGGRIKTAEEQLRAKEEALGAAEQARNAAEAASAGMQIELSDGRKKQEELEVLVMRSQEQVGALREELWALQQRLEEITRGKAETERECGRLIKELRALRTQVDEGEQALDRLRTVVRSTELQLMESARESEEGVEGMAMLRMSNAELQGRVCEAENRLRESMVVLEEERSEHMETQRKLHDALALLEAARGEQRELVAKHTRALEEQHGKEVGSLERQAAEAVRKAEDRIRELQREVVAKEEQRAAMARHAEALEEKLSHAQEEARAYLRTVEGSNEKHKEVARSKDDALRAAQLQVQQLERTLSDAAMEHKSSLESTVAELNRAAARAKEEMLADKKAALDRAGAQQREAERKLVAEHKAKADAVLVETRSKLGEELERLKAQLRQEQHEAAAQISALENAQREAAGRAEDTLRDRMRAVEAECRSKVEKAFAESAERADKIEAKWREQLAKAEVQHAQRMEAVQLDAVEAARAAKAAAAQVLVEHDKELAAQRKQFAEEIASVRAEREQAVAAHKDAQARLKEEHAATLQALKEANKAEVERQRSEQRVRAQEFRQELQAMQERHDAELMALRETHVREVNDVREEAEEGRKDFKERLVLKDKELERAAQTQREAVEEVRQEAAALREEGAKQLAELNEKKRELSAALVDLATLRTSEGLLQSLLKDARAEGAAKEEEQRRRAGEAEAQLAALKLAHAQLEGRASTQAAEVDRLKGQLAEMSREVPDLKAKIHEHVCARAELEGRLQAAEEEQRESEKRLESERAELAEQRSRVATLQSAVVDKEKMEQKLAAMEAKYADYETLESQLTSLSDELASSHQRVAELEQAAAEERARKLGPMAAVVPASFDAWAPKSPSFRLPSFSMPSVAFGASASAGDKASAKPEDGGKGADNAGAEAPGEEADGGTESTAGMRDEDLKRELAAIQSELAQERARSEGLERRLSEARTQLHREHMRVYDEGREEEEKGEGCDDGDDGGENTPGSRGEERQEDGGGGSQGEEVAAMRRRLAEVREARAAADAEVHEGRMMMEALRREFEVERQALAESHRREISALFVKVRGGEGEGGDGGDGGEGGLASNRIGGEEGLAELEQQLRMMRMETQGAHEAARVADAAANAAEKRVRALEKERHEEFMIYRERETKSREQIRVLNEKLAACEDELERVRKRMWVKEREAQVLQTQVSNLRAGSSGGSHRAWGSSGAQQQEMDELRRQLAATEAMLAERTLRVRGLEEQLGVEAESRWSLAQGLGPMSYDGHHQAALLSPAAAAAGGSTAGGDGAWAEADKVGKGSKSGLSCAVGPGSGGGGAAGRSSVASNHNWGGTGCAGSSSLAGLGGGLGVGVEVVQDGKGAVGWGAVQVSAEVESGDRKEFRDLFGDEGDGGDWMGEAVAVGGRGDAIGEGGGGGEQGQTLRVFSPKLDSEGERGNGTEHGLFGGLSAFGARGLGSLSARLPFLSDKTPKQVAGTVQTGDTRHENGTPNESSATGEGILSSTARSGTSAQDPNAVSPQPPTVSRATDSPLHSTTSWSPPSAPADRLWPAPGGSEESEPVRSVSWPPRAIDGWSKSQREGRETGQQAESAGKSGDGEGEKEGVGQVALTVARSRSLRGVLHDEQRRREAESQIQNIRTGRSVADEDEASLFSSEEWLSELQSAGKGSSGKTTAHFIGYKAASRHRSAERSFWQRSAAEAVRK